MPDTNVFIITTDELFTITTYGSAISAVGILIYTFLMSFIKNNAIFTGKIVRFLYSVIFSITTYVITYFILHYVNIKLGFSDVTPVGIVSTIFIYIGSSYFNKNLEIQ